MMKNTRQETHLNISLDELEVIAKYKLTDPDKMYKHCMADGIVYADEYETPLIDIYRLTGRKDLPFKTKYNISTGVCQPCYKIIKKNLDDNSKKNKRKQTMETTNDKPLIDTTTLLDKIRIASTDLIITKKNIDTAKQLGLPFASIRNTELKYDQQKINYYAINKEFLDSLQQTEKYQQIPR